MEFIPLLTSIEVDGQVIYASQICEMMKRGDVEDFLQYVYSKYGYNSVEFIFTIQGFVYRLLNFYSNEGGYDLLMDVVSKVLDKMREYEQGKGKLSSYIYTIVRGEVTKWRSKMKYYNMLFVDAEKDDEINIEELYKQEVDECDELYRLKHEADTVYRRVEMWELIKEELQWK